MRQSTGMIRGIQTEFVKACSYCPVFGLVQNMDGFSSEYVDRREIESASNRSTSEMAGHEKETPLPSTGALLKL